MQKTLARVLQRFWWPSVNRDVAQYTQSCSACAARTSAGRKPRAPLQERPWPRADRPFHALEMDIKGPLPMTSSSFQYIFVIQDAFSRYTEMCPLRRPTTEEVCVEVRRWNTRYGIPVTVHSDRGSCFTSRAFADFCSQYGTVHTLSTSYHPQANCAVERLNRSDSCKVGFQSSA